MAKTKNNKYQFGFYVAGQTPKSIRAFTNLKQICEEYLRSGYSLEVIDLLENPKLAKGDHILAIPTLVRKRTLPTLRIIGNMSNTHRALRGLNILPAG